MSPCVQAPFTERKPAHPPWRGFTLGRNPPPDGIRSSGSGRATGQGPGLKTAIPAAQYIAVPNDPAKLWAPGEPSTW